ncbi:MAG TPA: response regulator [Pyrinomonadaceae bacterium]|nr:response regulator [Pyrinomonadaceae bacterium]
MLLPEETAFDEGSARPVRLLVVDDEENIVLTIGEVLRREGYEVDVAFSGTGAGALVRETEYDLVLTDFHMADGDGLSVLREIQTYSPLTIAIILTGFASVENAILALRHGAYDYLVKPCIIEELKHTVRRGLEHRRLILAEREARRSLEELNQELEHRVEERTAELQRLNEDLVEANRAKDIFLATLSHELRTPLTPVLGWVNLLRSGGVALDASLMKQGLDAIERNAKLQARLVDDLLDISRIVSGKLRIEWEPVNLCAVAEAAIETMRESAVTRGIELRSEMPDCPLVVQGAPVRLQQIALNLLSNAVKFTPDKGSVTLRAFREGGEAHLVIEDTGQGIAPEFLPHVFDRFRQADGTTTRAHGGLGLGLAIVRALADLHNGRVSAESDGPNKGARFTFTMPCATTRGAEGEAAGASPEELPPVLIVEDSPETLELLQMLFARRGYFVMGANSAAEALRRAAEMTPGVIISDVGLPDVDGNELLAQLRRLPGVESVPAIALSGYTTDEDRDRALAAGFTVHFAKPVDPDKLLETVRQLTVV